MTEYWPHHYGDTFVGGEIAERGTIHGSHTIDIQLDPVTKRIVAVWFRCRTLPFTVSEAAVSYGSTGEEQPPIKVTAVEFLESAG